MARSASGSVASDVDSGTVQRTLVFIALHLPLGFAIKASPWIATAHALATAFIAFVLIAEARRPERILPVLGYVVVSESLWRVGRAMVFHETAKYLLALLSMIAILRFGRRLHLAKMPVFYFALLLPSIAVMPHFDRQDVSFNLSGPFSLAVATILCSRFPITLQILRRTFTTLMGPTVALAAVATFSTLTTDHIDFYTSKIASGGLGQNQASSLFGLGALVAFLYLALLPRHTLLNRVFAILGLWCAGQAALTFSRGGLATTLGAVAAAAFYLTLDRRFRGSTFLRIALVAAVASLFAFPLLDSLTGGELGNRFTSTSLTGRDRIVEADLLVFRENPLFGVGPGQSYDLHARTFRKSSAHTEYSRLLAEHGLFGLTALLLLLGMGARWVLQQPSSRSKALSAALVVWSGLYMFHAAMRMAAVSFVFALAAGILVETAPRVASSVRLMADNAQRPGLRPRA